MRRPSLSRPFASLVFSTLSTVSALAPLGAQPSTAKRPLNFLDVQNMQQASAPVLSPNGNWALYTLSVPDWKDARRQSDLYLVSTQQGLSSTRRLTYTADKNETSPAWSRDGKFFAFLSDRDAPTNAAGRGGSSLPTSGPGAPYFPSAVGGGSGGASFQLYLMRADGGEARRITDARDGVTAFAFSKDGSALVYRSGPTTQEQLYSLSVATLVAGDSARATQLTRHPNGIGLWKFSPDAKRIYFVTADSTDPDEKLRLEKKFDVRVRNAEVPVSSLWALDLDSKRTSRLTRDTSYSVGDFSMSEDGKWIGFRGISSNRYERNILEQNENADLYLLELASGQIERLTRNKDIAEGMLDFSPDSRTVAFSAPDDFTFMHNAKLYVRETTSRGSAFKKLGSGFDGDVTTGFWSKDGKTVYFNDGVKATNQVLAIDIASNNVRPVFAEQVSVTASQNEETGRILINYSDPHTPANAFTVASVNDLNNRSAWVQLTNANAMVKQIALGDAREITWKSLDGRSVGGVLTLPVGYQAGKRYPLVVSIHGGPAAADVLGFQSASQVYAGAGYVVLQPNYRNSTNYGQKFKVESQGDYFTKGYQDIMAGVDHLIAQGMVDSSQMGVMGWSAGGHWSNWILTHTDRFKAISTGAGVFNWISMYGQSDTQRGRQWYLGDKLYYDDMEHWWKQSPAAYIKNAKTPTLIHVVDNDPRVPRPQSEELHMALKRLGVPTEFFVYPGNTHGIPDPRNQYVKATAELAWMDYWVRHSGKKFAWRDVLKTLDDAKDAKATVSMVP